MSSNILFNEQYTCFDQQQSAIKLKMPAGSKQRGVYDGTSNQSYLNFIKKNHELIHQDQGRYAPTNPLRKEERKQGPCRELAKPQNPEVVYNSLAVFHSDFNRDKQAYNASKYRSISYADEHKPADVQPIFTNTAEIADKIFRGRQREALKNELLFHLKKNQSNELKKTDGQREKAIAEKYLCEQNVLRLPQIDPKKPKEDICVSLDDFSDQRFASIGKRALKRPDQILTQSEKSNTEKHPNDRIMKRKQMYGLLPSFRTPFLAEPKKNFGGLNKTKMKSEKGEKCEKEDKTSWKESGAKTPQNLLIAQTLEANIIFKSLSLQSKSIQKLAIFNKQLNVVEQREEQIEIVSENKQQKEPQAKEGETQTKNKPKKQVEQKNDPDLTIYEMKIRSYREFLFMVNLAHRKFDPIILKDHSTFRAEHRYKYYLGGGNNSMLIKSLMQRRFWWTLEEELSKSNFVWTQLKLNHFYQFQRKTTSERNYITSENQEESTIRKKDAKSFKNGIYKPPFPPCELKVFTATDKKYYDDFVLKSDNPQRMLKFANRLKYFPEDFMSVREDIGSERVHNHFQFNYFIGNKKALFYNIKQYYDLLGKDAFKVIPLTFHIKTGMRDPQYEVFIKEFKRLQKERHTKNVWIVKPGELSNRGQGITVIDEIYELNTILKKKDKHSNGIEKTYIIQKYIEKPLLYKGRKFDLRHYMLMSRLHGKMRAYFFGEGYIRTSSQEYDLNQIGDCITHLTNDAIQKYSQGYGRYEEGNKVSYCEFQRYMDATYGENKFHFSDMIYNRMRQIALDAVKATYLQLDPAKMEHNFQIFGLDFMIDSHYNVMLIEVNTNPCLQLSSKLLGRIIPNMVQQSLRLTLDVIYPPPAHYLNTQKYLAPDNPLERLQFELIFDEDRDGAAIVELYSKAKKLEMGDVEEDDETYENEGKEIELQNELN